MSSSSRPHLPSLHFIDFNTRQFQNCFAVPCNACKKFTTQVVGSAIQLMSCPGQGLNDRKYVLDLTVLLYGDVVRTLLQVPDITTTTTASTYPVRSTSVLAPVHTQCTQSMDLFSRQGMHKHD